MKKTEKYLPLKWCEDFLEYRNQSELLCNISTEEIGLLLDEQSSTTSILNSALTNSDFAKFVLLVQSQNENIRNDLTDDYQAFYVSSLWSKNKQVYKFDEDFLDELINTETISFSENQLDYLPYDTFYIDLSANRRICQQILGEGVYIHVKKILPTPNSSREEERIGYYSILACKITDKLFFSDRFRMKNCNWDDSVDNLPSSEEVSIIQNQEEWESKMKNNMSNTAPFNGQLYNLLLHQVLTFLSSKEPDISENEETKATYRKPAPNSPPKNKYSEIQKWDVGIRIGSAFRKWKKQNSTNEKSATRSGTGRKHRPHYRRAHWSHYWYGHGAEKERRPKWIAACYVGTSEESYTDSGVIIHPVESNTDR